MQQWKRIAGILLLFFFCIPTVWAQEKRPMTMIDMLEVPSLRGPQLSPDGKQVLFVLSETDWKKNRQISHIWRINVDGTGLVQMTSGENGEHSPVWSPDGKMIAFLARRGEAKQTQIYLIANSGGEAQQLSHHETSVSSIQWSPDGQYIYFLASDPKTKEEKEREKKKDDVYAFDENYKQRHLWRISVRTGKEGRITEGNFSVLSYRLSRDGKKIVFHRGPTPLYDDFDEGEVWVMDADGANAIQLTHNQVPEYGARLSPDNRYVLFLSDANEKFEPYYNDNIFIVPAEGGTPKLLAPDLPYEIRSADWCAEGKTIYFLANTGVRTELFAMNWKKETVKQLTSGDHTIYSWSYNPQARAHVFCVRDPENPGDVWFFRYGKLQRVTHVFDYLRQYFLLPKQEAIRWKGEDGVTVEGILIYPLNYQKGKRYPVVVHTHGGPASSSKFGFSSWSVYAPVLAAKGYAVFLPNYRGSTGYGDDFLRDMVGHYFNQSHKDVMTGVDYLIEKGIADPERLAKRGWSAGGHMTNKIITYTDRFKAASSGAGAVNWISMYGQSDVRIYRTPWFGGTPWQKDAPIDVYWEHSPLKYIWRVKTPTIIFVGEKDVRVPPPQSVELYRALKSNGVPTKLYIAPREPHGWRELRHRLFKMNAEMEWFEKYVMNREYEWEKAPEKGKGDLWRKSTLKP
jgi:dipeptidyl aminopeptidase/acylaminoacyl peptidase